MDFALSRSAPPSPSFWYHPVERLNYRADIDGLRALAVLPVVFYHAGIFGFGGGFVGVDVFFVISGYLMAAVIIGELDRGEFSLLQFYERRVRRIFPALFAMIAASAVMAWFVFMPVEFTYFARSLKATVLFISNIRFQREVGYFDIESQLKPLLHTWSLAVEEQFYIVFPVAVMLIVRFFRRYLAHILLATLAASLIASTLAVYRAPEKAFYLAQYRAWELLLGAVLTLNLLPRPTQRLAREAMAGTGVVLIGVSVATFRDGMAFPGLAALLPCLGAALIIHARAAEGPISSVLRAQPLVFIGLISYSLYLWHWPIIVYSRHLSGVPLTTTNGWMIVAASIVVAWCSWRFIERPFRGSSSRIARKPLFVAAAGVVATFAAFGVFVASEKGLPSRLSPAARLAYNATYDKSPYRDEGCFKNSDGNGPSTADISAGNLCQLGIEGQNPSFLVWGDSHAAAMSPAIDVAAEHAGLTGLLAGEAGCPPLLDVRLSDRRDKERCGEFNAAVLDLIRSRRIPLVILPAYWPKYVHAAELPNEGVYFDASVPPPLDDHSAPILEAMDRTLLELKRMGTKVVLVMDVPEMGRYVPEALAKAIAVGASTDIAPPLSYIEKRQVLSRAMLEQFAGKYGAVLVDPMPAFCDIDRCYAVRNGVPLYTDGNHLTATAAKALSYLFTPLFRSFDSSVATVGG
jgi:peptidoglycan/LPS O-acetylase OafA/YrhL